MRKYSRVTAAEVLETFHSDSEYGLPNNSIPGLKKAHGPNKIAEEDEEHIVMKYIEHFKDPLILLLLGSAILSILVGQFEDAFSIAAAVVIVGSVAFYQEYKSEESLEALNNLVPPTANVLRSGNYQTILAEELVPGDIIKLHCGDRVPADARIIQSNAFMVDESSLTGEVEPKEKRAEPLPDLPENAEVNEFSNICFMGTLVTSGHASCVVVATGLETEFGKTSQEMKDIESRRTPLQTKMDDLGKRLSIFSMGIIVCIGIIGMIKGKSFLAMFNIGVSLAVAAIPEGLPICVTVTLALGVMRMAKKNAIVKKLPAVEALGCANYICTDKTGTLTENKMTVVKAFAPVLEDTVSFHYHEGIDLLRRNASIGLAAPSHREDGINGTVSLSQKYGLTSFELRYHGQVIDIKKFIGLQALFDAACLCNNATVTYPASSANMPNGSSSSNSSEANHPMITGQPTEGALLVAANKLGIPDRRNRLKRIRETNFTSETKFMEVIYSNITSNDNINNNVQSESLDSEHPATAAASSSAKNPSASEVHYVKGALEVVLPQCVTYLSQNGELLLLSTGITERIQYQCESMASEGLRVLAIAYGNKHNQLTFAGLIGLMDPLRFGVIEAVHRIQDSGAKVMMITGDSETTAIAIAKMAGIYDSVNASKTLSGKEIEELVRAGEESLASVISDVSVCYRTSPRHKLSIVRALQLRGFTVAMTGDGVNDAPALKSADIGVAMGSGTDVAKEASAMIVVDNDFSTIVSAIEEGKSIFFNIKNFLTFQLSTSIAALSLVALNNLFGRPNPLNPMQILWINIIMDGPLAQSLGVEIVDPTIMRRPPRKRTDDIITRPLLYRVISSGILILLGTWYVFLHEMEDGAISSRDLTMTFTTFVMFDMFNALACRHNSRTVLEISWNSNPAFLLAASFSLGGQFLVIYFPFLQNIFRTVPLSFEDIFFVFFLASTMLLLDFIRKRYFSDIFVEKISTKLNDIDRSSLSTKKGSKEKEAFMV